MNQVSFTDALSIVNKIGINPDTVHPLDWGIMWVNLQMLHVTNFGWPADTWQEYLDHLAFPDDNPLPTPEGAADLATQPYHLKLVKTVEAIYQKGEAV